MAEGTGGVKYEVFYKIPQKVHDDEVVEYITDYVTECTATRFTKSPQNCEKQIEKGLGTMKYVLSYANT